MDPIFFFPEATGRSNDARRERGKKKADDVDMVHVIYIQQYYHDYQQKNKRKGYGIVMKGRNAAVSA